MDRKLFSSMALILIGAMLAGCAPAASSPAGSASTPTIVSSPAAPSSSPTVAGSTPTGDPNKAGGAGQNRLTLTILTGESDPGEATAYAQAVESASAGTIDVKVDNGLSVGVKATYETDVIQTVAAGKAELGFVAARAFDTLGVKSFQALHAPFLIDSYALEDKVLSSDWGRRLLEGPRQIGVVGLGYLQGPMRRPLGITRDLLTLADFQGAAIGIRGSTLNTSSMKALGAIPRVFVQGDTSGLDAMEAHLGIIDNAGYDTGAKSLTGNVIFWPRPGVIMANAAALDGLTAGQQRILREAADATYQQSVIDVAHFSTVHRDDLCGRGLKIVNASQDALMALRKAVQPVYDDLETDPGTKATIEAVTALRTSMASAADTVTACSGTAASPSPSASPALSGPFDGTWANCFTREEFVAAGPGPGEMNPGNWGCGTMVFKAGTFYQYATDDPSPHASSGTYAVDGATLTISPISDPERWQYTWSLFNDQLTLKKTGVGGPTGIAVKPWTRQP
jgi:TRAP-type C4-dicarboxylate transport system substrate-binding protein